MSNPEKIYDIKRYDSSIDRSLKPFSAADEYLLQDFLKLTTKPRRLAIYHDRFGFLTCHLHLFNPTIILTNKSQQRAIDLNLKANNLLSPRFSNPLSPFDEKIEFALIKAPKSLALYELFLEQIAQNSTKEVTVVIAFMTRHFSPKLIEIAQKYFEGVEQSRAVKKARLVTLTKKKQVVKLDIIDVLNYKDQAYKQYWGVFSAKHIDYATQYFLEYLELNPIDSHILDLGSGNGVIGKEIMQRLPNAEIHLMDDSYLAVESAKLNIQGEHIHHHFNNDLSNFEDGTFDLIVTNPPFHFEYEINIKIPIQLFKECFRCLKVDGNLQIVANKHLNYITHLKSIFSTAEVLAQNDKFIIYKCVK
jgi:16S rRNA G1207 methylase RsmC